MTHPLQGSVLIDCVRANAAAGLPETMARCGYDQDQAAFMTALTAACEQMGVDLSQLMVNDSAPDDSGIWIAPESPTQL